MQKNAIFSCFHANVECATLNDDRLMTLKTKNVRNLPLNIFAPWTHFLFVSKKAMQHLIHHIWIQGYDAVPLELQQNISAIKALNPGFRHVLWNDATIIAYITNLESQFQFLLGMLQLYMNPPVHPRISPFAIKSDIARYCILFGKGGVYMDVDVKCIGSIDTMLNTVPCDDASRCEIFVGIHRWMTVEYASDQFIMCKQNSLLMQSVLIDILSNVKGTSKLQFSGSPIYACYRRTVLDKKNRHLVWSFPQTTLSVYHCGSPSTCMVPTDTSSSADTGRSLMSMVCDMKWISATMSIVLLTAAVILLMYHVIRIWRSNYVGLQ